MTARRPRNLYVSLPDPAWEALSRAAIREDRRPKEQARRLILDGLRLAGYLDPDPDARAGVQYAAEAGTR